jgi:hypothetical protein
MVVGSGALLAEQRRPDVTAEMNGVLSSWKTEDILFVSRLRR